MLNVLIPTMLAGALLFASPVAAQSVPFCPDGWSCGSPRDHSATSRRTEGGSAICMLTHELATRDGKWMLVTLLYSTDTQHDAYIGFGLRLLQLDLPGEKPQPIPLRSFRLFSADRKLDTRAWRLDGADTTRTSASIKATDEVEKQIVASIAIATGSAYGVLAEATDGRRVRIEADKVPHQRKAIREFQACIENRDGPTRN